jgi:hypothetical protein
VSAARPSCTRKAFPPDARTHARTDTHTDPCIIGWDGQKLRNYKNPQKLPKRAKQILNDQLTQVTRYYRANTERFSKNLVVLSKSRITELQIGLHRQPSPHHQGPQIWLREYGLPDQEPCGPGDLHSTVHNISPAHRITSPSPGTAILSRATSPRPSSCGRA